MSNGFSRKHRRYMQRRKISMFHKSRMRSMSNPFPTEVNLMLGEILSSTPSIQSLCKEYSICHKFSECTVSHVRLSFIQKVTHETKQLYFIFYRDASVVQMIAAIFTLFQINLFHFQYYFPEPCSPSFSYERSTSRIHMDHAQNSSETSWVRHACSIPSGYLALLLFSRVTYFIGNTWNKPYPYMCIDTYP